jgi:hypothetical protein
VHVLQRLADPFFANAVPVGRIVVLDLKLYSDTCVGY